MTSADLQPTIAGKVVLITGGTGTVGVALARRLLDLGADAVRIFSRDENKQYFLRDRWSHVPNVRFFIGDVRERDRLRRAMEYCDLVFHLAALKHVESCEYNPFEAIRTNIVGTQNVIDCALDHEIPRVVFTSTDKAVNPANAMGASKLMAEKLMVAANYYKGRRASVFSTVRFGNVLASSGSVIPTFIQRIKLGLPIEVTDPGMTRYVITMDEAVRLVLDTLTLCHGGEILIRKMPVLRIVDLAEVLLELHGLPTDETHLRIVGARAGEKLYEELITPEEAGRTVDIGDYFVVQPQIGSPGEGDGKPLPPGAFTSESDPPLDKDGIRRLLRAVAPELFAESGS
jgi:UDP-N-acetylglucosamine 4,6-dehydratase/5-epimerase